MRRFAGRIGLIFCTISLLLPFSGCNKRPPRPQLEQIKIGVTLYKQDDTFISTISNYLQDAARACELRDNVKIALNIMDAKGNQSIQNDQVEKFLSQGYDVICVNEVDRTAASVIIDRAKVANIPVVFFNREPVQEDMQRWSRLYYVGSDASEAGRLQGDIVVNLYDDDPARVDRNGDGRIQYVMLEGEPGHQDAAIRTEYSIKRLLESGLEAEKLANETANWQRAQALPKVEQWIATFGDEIEVVFSNNDDMALGALDAYLATDTPEKRPVIVGIDATPPALEAIRDGLIDGTVHNNAQAQAQAIFDIAYAVALGEDSKLSERVPQLQGKYVWVPHRILTKETLLLEEKKENMQ